MSAMELEELVLEGRLARFREVLANRTRQLTVVLEALHKGHNQSAVLRSCDAFGVQDVHVIESEELRFRPCTSISSGSDKWLTLHRYREVGEAVAQLRARGYALWASSLDEGACTLSQLDLTGRVALLFGNERDGLSQELLGESDGCFRIPMFGFAQSFNVSVAASIALHEAVRQRVERWGKNGDLSLEEQECLLQRFTEKSVKPRVLRHFLKRKNNLQHYKAK